MDGRPNYQSALRIEKLDTIELVIERCSNKGLPTTKHELFVFCTERWGCEWRKFIEYINDLVMRRMIVIDGNELWSMRRWQKIQKARDKDHLKMKDLIYAN